MNDILKRFFCLDPKMPAGIVRRSFYRLGVSQPSAIVLGGVVGALAPEHLLVRLADQLS